jgi:DNA-binding NarL/FixJ family response regulator
VIRVLIADDQDLVRAGLRMILEAQPDIEVVGEAAHGSAAVAMVAEHAPDVVLMDIRMPGMDGLEATRLLLSRAGATQVLMLTTFDNDEYVYEALRAGAAGFLLKTAPPQRLVEAVRLIHAGEALLAPSVTRRLIATYVRRPPPGRPAETTRLASLTERELEVLREVGRGRSNSEIAADLVVAETTVKTHVNRLFAKLAVRDRVQAVVLAYETGLVQPGDDRPEPTEAEARP